MELMGPACPIQSGSCLLGQWQIGQIGRHGAFSGAAAASVVVAQRSGTCTVWGYGAIVPQACNFTFVIHFNTHLISTSLAQLGLALLLDKSWRFRLPSSMSPGYGVPITAQPATMEV